MKYIEPEMEVVEWKNNIILTLTSGEEDVDGIPTIDGSGM